MRSARGGKTTNGGTTKGWELQMDGGRKIKTEIVGTY